MRVPCNFEREKEREGEIKTTSRRSSFLSKSLSFSLGVVTSCTSGCSGTANDTKREQQQLQEVERRIRTQRIIKGLIVNMGQQMQSNDEQPLVAVAIDKDKGGSQNALKWALENLVVKGQTITLIHVNTQALTEQQDEAMCQANNVFLPFRCFCTRKEVNCNDVILQDVDVAKAITAFVSESTIEKLVVGASPSRGGGFIGWKVKSSDISTSISKGAPDFCTVYVISRGKVSTVRNSTRSAPSVNHLRQPMQSKGSIKPDPHLLSSTPRAAAAPQSSPRISNASNDRDAFRSPFARGTYGPGTRPLDFSTPQSDISFVSNGKPSIDQKSHQRITSAESYDHSFEMSRPSYSGYSATKNYSSNSQGSSSADDVEAEMNRLRLELKQTMNMYSTACREALAEKQKATELNHWKMQDAQKLEEARVAGEAALAMMEREKAKCNAAMEAAEAAKRIAGLELQRRINAEKMANKEAEEKKKALVTLANGDIRYRRYTIDEIEAATCRFAERCKIGEGGYGPVYKGHLDHTPVAIKVLRSDAAQGRSQFKQEIEILSCIRHPNMVLLLGACPEYGCLVYEYMANGSLEDRLFQQGNTPPISWQQRFCIAAEIGTGLLFLHQTKPEPLVHRDLKPGNILLDRNYGSKIADVGLARLVPPSVANSVTQYLMTSTAGTFCYIDPEYQQTGMLGVKSDIYSLGIMLLQIITAKPPMGLTHHVERSIEMGTFQEMLDPTVTNWPVNEALGLAQMALKCAELRRKDRPDLSTGILPLLNRLRVLAEANMQPLAFLGSNSYLPPRHSQVVPMQQDMISDPLARQSGYESRSSPALSYMNGRGMNR